MSNNKSFVAAVITPLIIDHIVTLYGQPAAYWNNFTQFNEAALVTTISFGPAVFITSTLVYASIVAILLLKLPQKYSLPLGLWVFIGHVWGSSSWIPGIIYEHNLNADHWVVSLIYFFVLSIFLAIGIRKWINCEEKKLD